MSYSDSMVGNCLSDDTKKIREVSKINDLMYCKKICDNTLDCKAVDFSKKKELCRLYGGSRLYKGDGLMSGFECYDKKKYVGYDSLNKNYMRLKKKIGLKMDNLVNSQNSKIKSLSNKLSLLNNDLKDKSDTVDMLSGVIKSKKKIVSLNKDKIVTNERMLQLTKDNIEYKQKIIYSLVGLIVLCFVIMMVGYVATRK